MSNKSRVHPVLAVSMLLTIAALHACGGADANADGANPAAGALQAPEAANATPQAPDAQAATLVPGSILSTPVIAPTADTMPQVLATGSAVLPVQVAGQTAPAQAATVAPSTAVAGREVAVATSSDTQVALASPAPAPTPAPAPATAAPAARKPVLSDLSQPNPSPTSTTQGVGSVNIPGCRRGYTAPSSLLNLPVTAIPASGGVFFTQAELGLWRQRIAKGEYVKPNDVRPGSPGDWSRIQANAADFLSKGEPVIEAATPASDLGWLGERARDHAFQARINNDSSAGVRLKAYLLAQAANPQLDFPGTLCITTSSGVTYDAYYFQSTWLLRFMVTYDFARTWLGTADRVVVENFIRRNAYFLATHNDVELAQAYPARLYGDYSQLASNAAPVDDHARWWAKRYDTNGDCKVDGNDDATAQAVYAYVNGSGALGPRLSVLSQYYNNRRSLAAAAFGAAGVLLGDANLVASASRYVMEWLAYGVWPDGSQGEYARNGDYCIANQGVIYGSANLQAAGLLSQLLARQGDTSLITFSTRQGLIGTESVDAAPAKSLELAIGTYLKLINGQAKWYFYQPQKGILQDYSSANSMSNFSVHYMASPQGMDDFHELGLLPLAPWLPRLPLAATVMRENSALPFPGATGNPVPTGNGRWTDFFNAMPAVFLLRP